MFGQFRQWSQKSHFASHVAFNFASFPKIDVFDKIGKILRAQSRVTTAYLYLNHHSPKNGHKYLLAKA